MKEAFLQYVWKNGLFDHMNMRTETGEKIEILRLGVYNTDSGPDFLNSQIKIGNTIWAGNVEVHVRASDWFRHKHQFDKSYNNVILHVVDRFDKIACDFNGREILTYKLVYSQALYKEYEYLFKDRRLDSCFATIDKNNIFKINFWLQRLLVERLLRKSQDVLRLFKQNQNSWEETIYQLVARYFGLNVNAEPFEQLARSLPLKVIARQKESPLQIEALLFGQSGLLQSDNPDAYQCTLIKEYDYLRKKHTLEPINVDMWKFMRTRPYNFPTVRIAQFSSFIYNSNSLFASIMESDNIEQIKKLFKFSTSIYWDTHFCFNDKTKRKSSSMGKSTLDIVIINAVIPTIFAYGRYVNNEIIMDRAIDLLEKIPLEKNYITNMWKQEGLPAKSAADSQALVQLKKEYCDKKRCLHCELGNKLMSEII
ncbi:MAG: DUF2851 family protein [Marinifilaceae bacterium]